MVACLALGLPIAATAQVDSLATVARNRYREAIQAASRGAVAEARDLMTQAHQAWPTQIAYPVAAAQLSARLRDPVATARWLGVIADLGLTIPLESDSTLAALAGAPAVARVARRLDANARPLIRSRAIPTDAPADFYPEGIDYDPQSRTWLLASVRKRTVVRVGLDGRTVPFPNPDGRPLDAALAVRVDPARALVWVTTRVLPAMEGYQPGQPNEARVVVFDRKTGGQLAAAAAPADGAPHLFGDLAIHPSGMAYFTDSESPVVYRARYHGGQIEIEEVARHRFFRSLQGLAFDQSGSRLYLADYSHGLLILDLATKAVRSLAPPRGTSLLGLDGIGRFGSTLIAIQNGVAPPRVLQIRLTGDRVDRVDVIDRNVPVADEPTIGTLTEGQWVYVANSQWEKYDDGGRLKVGSRLRSPVLLAVPLRRR